MFIVIISNVGREKYAINVLIFQYKIIEFKQKKQAILFYSILKCDEAIKFKIKINFY